jgi:hypothetical protein
MEPRPAPRSAGVRVAQCNNHCKMPELPIQSYELRAFNEQTKREGHCLVWIGKLDRYGRGLFHFRGKTVAAHRWAYERVHGKVPDGMAVMQDYFCVSKACVEPLHLEAMSKSDAGMRAYMFYKRTGL